MRTKIGDLFESLLDDNMCTPEGEKLIEEYIESYFTPSSPNQVREIPTELFKKLELLGFLDTTGVRSKNEGESNYSAKTIQPWAIWLDYPELTSWDHDIVKRILRSKKSDSRKMDYEKIIHICNERIRQINIESNETD